jgi:hypothetical protein
MVPPSHAQNCGPVAPLPDSDQRQHGTVIIEKNGIFVARQS